MTGHGGVNSFAKGRYAAMLRECNQRPLYFHPTAGMVGLFVCSVILDSRMCFKARHLICMIFRHNTIITSTDNI